MASSMGSRTNRGSETELCYASPKVTSFPLPSDIPSGPPARGGRKRRSNGSSEDGSQEEQFDGFINEDLRAGGPYICSIPFLSSSLPQNHPLARRLEVDPTTLYNSILQILRQYNIDYLELDFCGRQSQSDPEQAPIPTACILARKHSLDSSWIDASQKIRSYLVSEGLSDVSIEITDPHVLEPMHYSPVLESDAIYPVWDRVCETILRRLDLKDWKCLECFRTGRNEDTSANPPTIFVTVMKNSPRDWKRVREDIITIVDSSHLSTVGVSIAEGEIVREQDFNARLPWTGFKDGAQVGLSLGVSGSNKSSFTLGGLDRDKASKVGIMEAACSHLLAIQLQSLENNVQNKTTLVYISARSSIKTPVRLINNFIRYYRIS